MSSCELSGSRWRPERAWIGSGSELPSGNGAGGPRFSPASRRLDQAEHAAVAIMRRSPRAGVLLGAEQHGLERRSLAVADANGGAQVVQYAVILGVEWGVVTNGRQWRLYQTSLFPVHHPSNVQFPLHVSPDGCSPLRADPTEVPDLGTFGALLVQGVVVVHSGLPGDLRVKTGFACDPRGAHGLTGGLPSLAAIPACSEAASLRPVGAGSGGAGTTVYRPVGAGGRWGPATAALTRSAASWVASKSVLAVIFHPAAGPD